MNSNSNAVGLSARHKINHFFNNNFWILALMLVLIFATVLNTSGQHGDLKKGLPKTSNEPKVDIKVNRHYDNEGNIIGYDSTYSSYYSNVPGDTTWVHSPMKDFD